MPGRARPVAPDALRAAVAAQGGLLGAALAAADAEAPSRGAGQSVGDLDRRLGAVLGGLAEALEGSPAATPDAVASAGGPRLVEVLPRLLTALDSAAPSAADVQRTVLALVELVAAGRDLPTPVAPERAALRLAVKALAGLLAERAPGRHVEARVPPYAAVQCVEGPRHTRGTPPNVVEVDPVAFLELATGRLAWADGVADGRVRTWGDRADLSPWLPLLP